MAMPGRNDPCPCGSGKKYKNCHLRTDEAAPLAMRLIHGDAGASRGAGTSAVKLPPGAVVPADAWEADLMPFAAEIADDPTARMTVLMIGAGEYVLAVDVIAHPPSEAAEVAALLSVALADCVRATGVRPEVVQVRLAALVDELAELLADESHAAHGARVVASRPLARLDDALASLEERTGVPRAEPGALLASQVTSYACWGFAPADLERFFVACASFYAAQPWLMIDDRDPFTFRMRDGGAWETVVLGTEFDVPGLSMYEEAADVWRAFDDLSTTPGAPEQIRGAVIMLGFEVREDLPKRMREEIKQAKWPVAGPTAYPFLSAVNTPGGGITARQLRAMTAALEAVPGFVEQFADAITGKTGARFPLRYTHKPTGATIEMNDAAPEDDKPAA
jgi:hypothetical protein